MPSRQPRTSKLLTTSPAGGKKARPPAVTKPWKTLLRSRQQTHRLGRCLGILLEGGEVVALFGEMGTGKTSLVRGIADGLGAEPMAVSSPTFTLIHEYRGRLPLIHTDLYRLSAAQLENTGLGDYVDGRAILAVEWAERWGAGLPHDRLEIYLTHHPPSTRQAVLTARGPSASRLLLALRSRMSVRRPTRVVSQTRVQ